MINATVVGSLNMDVILEVERLPQVGETLLSSQASLAHGGKGANQAVAIARLGGQVHMVGKLGDDAFGEQIRQGLEAAGVDTSFVGTTPQTLTGLALIMLAQGDNTIVVASGANYTVTPEDVDAASAAFEDSQVLLVQFELPLDTVARAMELAQKRGLTVILDPGPARECPVEFLALADYITPNQTEASMLTGIQVLDQETARQAAHRLLEHARQGVIVKMGGAGSLIITRDSEHHIEVIPVDVVDTTAAGDAFCGALAVGLAGGLSLLEAARFANVVGALTVTRLGAQPSLPTRAEVERFIAERGLSIKQPWDHH